MPLLASQDVLPRPRSFREEASKIEDAAIEIEAAPGVRIERQIVQFQLAGNLLEQVMAVGDVLAVGGSSISRDSQDDLRILVVIQAPHSVPRYLPEVAKRLAATKLELDAVSELWCVRTLECIRGVTCCAEALLYVERCSGILVFLGTVLAGGTFEPELSRAEIQLWQSPLDLRRQLDSTVVEEAVAAIEAELLGLDYLDDINAGCDWPAPILETGHMSPLLFFWHMYLTRLDRRRRGISSQPIEKLIPQNALATQGKELFDALKKLGWVAIKTVPMIFQQAIHWQHNVKPSQQEASTLAPAVYGEKALCSRGATTSGHGTVLKSRSGYTTPERGKGEPMKGAPLDVLTPVKRNGKPSQFSLDDPPQQDVFDDIAFEKSLSEAVDVAMNFGLTTAVFDS